MSHNFTAPPIAPFDPQLVYADPASTSALEDGSLAHPYKTIQDALDARPTPTSDEDAQRPWIIRALGDFDESIVIPSTGIFHIIGDSTVRLGTPANPQTFTWTPGEPDFSEAPSLTLENVRILASISIGQADASISFSLTLKSCYLETEIDGNGIIGDVDTASLTLEDCTLISGITWLGYVTMRRCTITGDCTVDRFDLIQDCTTQNLTASETDQAVVMQNVTVGGSISFGGGCDILENVSAVACSMGATGVGRGIIRGCRFTAFVSLGDISVIDATTFSSTVTIDGGSLHVSFYQTTIAALLTVTNGPRIQEAHHSQFLLGITVDDTIMAGLFSCLVVGAFTGPIESLLADSVTVSRSVYSLEGGATLFVVGASSGGGGGGGLEVNRVTLLIPGGSTAGTVGRLQTSPVAILPAPGLGKFIVPIRAQWEAVWPSSSPEAYNGAMSGFLGLRSIGGLGYGVQGPSVSGFLGNFIGAWVGGVASDGRSTFFSVFAQYGTDSQHILHGDFALNGHNLGMEVFSDTNDPYGSTGNASLRVTVWYEIHDMEQI